MKKSSIVVAGMIGLCFVIAVVVAQYLPKPPLISPLSNDIATSSQNLESAQTDKVVYGFVPFWQISSFVLQPELTHVAYFSLTFNGSGKILTVENGKTDPGYRVFQSSGFLEKMNQAKDNNTSIDLVVSQLNNKDIEAFLNSPAAQQSFYSQMHEVLLSYTVSGINIDVEYQGNAKKELRDQFTVFIKNFTQFLDTQHPETMVSIDVYASSIMGNNIWNIPELEPYVDYFIIMGYDFHKAGSPLAGPVAPLLAEGVHKDQKHITQYVAEFLKHVPSKKILLGVPFYGYEWQTVSDDPRAATYPRTGATASFQRIQQILANPELSVQQYWEETTLSPYLTFKQDEKQKLIFYEDERSLGYKLDLINQSNLGGIAIWALGYEGPYRNLWEVIQTKL